MADELPLIGFGLPVSGVWATPRTMVDVARRAEELGYASLWSFQRLLRPAAGLDPSFEAARNPGRGSIDDPAYHAVHDPVAPLAYVAGHTERIGLGTATICAPFVAPALLAKQMATLDMLSGGRVTVGIGSGWLPQEFEAAGASMERRGARMDEYVRCLEALWTRDPVEFAGEFYSVPRGHLGVFPVQRPHPPVLLGGAAPAALRRAGSLAQGWISSSRHDLATIAEGSRVVRAAASAAGRDPDSVRVVVRGVVDLVDTELDSQRRPLQGSRDQVLADLAALRQQGATEVIVDLNFSPRVVSPHVSAGEAVRHAERVLDAFAPAAPAQ